MIPNPVYFSHTLGIYLLYFFSIKGFHLLLQHKRFLAFDFLISPPCNALPLFKTSKLVGSMTDPTNQHKTFQYALSSLAHFLGNFPEGHPSQNCSKPSTLNCGVFM